MDNSNPTMQPPAENTTPQVPVSTQPSVPQVQVSEPSSGDSKNVIFLLVIGLVVVIVLVGGIYLFLSRQQTNTAETATEQPIAQATPQPPDTIDALDKDLSALNVENADSDFASIDQDLQQL